MLNFNDIFKSSFLENISSVSILDMALALALAFGIDRKSTRLNSSHIH